MGAMISPGVEILEIDASAIVPTIGASVAVFGGSFVKGPTGVYTLITNATELVGFYGAPTNKNYNEFFQCKTFLDYGNTLLVSRGLSSTAKNAIGFATAKTSYLSPLER